MLSDDTIKRLTKLNAFVEDLKKVFGVDTATAWQMAAANGAYKAWETAKAHDEQEKQRAEIEINSLRKRVGDHDAEKKKSRG